MRDSGTLEKRTIVYVLEKLQPASALVELRKEEGIANTVLHRLEL